MFCLKFRQNQPKQINLFQEEEKYKIKKTGKTGIEKNTYPKWYIPPFPLQAQSPLASVAKKIIKHVMPLSP